MSTLAPNLKAQSEGENKLLDSLRNWRRDNFEDGDKLGEKGSDMAILPEEERKRTEKETALREEVERRLPDFVKVCRDEVGLMIIHQDSFAADYQDDEYRLLGMAIKFAGLYGKEVRIIGKSRESLKGSGKPELVQ